uniref:Uncharacterized protein n=1 Tax=Rhizophora mucronata TaxID=61149 RepID=A0A2P2P4S1_RHIMU
MRIDDLETIGMVNVIGGKNLLVYSLDIAIRKENNINVISHSRE